MEASYEWPFQAHATMGPGCAVADVRADGVTTVWTGAQKPHALQQGLAQMLRVSREPGARDLGGGRGLVWARRR